MSPESKPLFTLVEQGDWQGMVESLRAMHQAAWVGEPERFEVLYLAEWAAVNEIAYDRNLPVGPTDVVLLGLIYFLAFLGKKLWSLCSKPTGARN